MEGTSANPSRTPKAQGAASRLVATRMLTRILDDGKNLDALCDTNHGSGEFLNLSRSDQGLVRAILTSALRNRNSISVALNIVMDRKPPKNARFLIHSLHVAVTQILFMDIPDSAAVNLAVNQIGSDVKTKRFRSLSNAVLRRLSREKEKILSQIADVPFLSDWLSKSIRRDFGKDKMVQCDAMIGFEPHLDLTVKSSPDKWADTLNGDVQFNGSVRTWSKTPVSTLPGYDTGEWWVQDTASAIPAELVGEVNGKRVLDLCAAPGGKTAQLIAAGAEVTAVEISKSRLGRLRENLDRLGFTAELIESDILEWASEKTFDAVLLDAPCSSTGTIRRHPDVMWSKGPSDVRELVQLQIKLIVKAASFLNSGGVLVYSNCSILKAEGEDIIPKIHELVPELSLQKLTPEEFPVFKNLINGQGALRTLPFHNEQIPKNRGGMDAFFACRFEKN